MARQADHDKAIKLRRQGKSYSEIKSTLGVAKGTLSAWLKNYPLSEKRLRALRDWNQQRIEHYRETRRKQREEGLRIIYEREKKILGRLSRRDAFIGGLFLYWGEGGKTKDSWISIANTDPGVIRAFIYWLEQSFDIDRSKVKIRLHLYRGMNIRNEVAFWSKTLQLGQECFYKPSIKKRALQNLSYRNGFGHGTCNAILINAMVAKRVLMGLKALREFYIGPVVQR